MRKTVYKSKFGKRNNRGNRVDDTWVFGWFERESGKMFMILVAFRSSVFLFSIIQFFIAPGTTIISDCLKAFDCLDKEGFVYLKVNYSINFKDVETRFQLSSAG